MGKLYTFAKFYTFTIGYAELQCIFQNPVARQVF